MAGLYIFLSLFTAVIFILTRDSNVSIIKRDILTVRLDLTFFALTLYKRDKTKKKKSSPELMRKIYSRIKGLLAVSKIEVRSLNIPIFPNPESPSDIPFISANGAVSYMLLGYLSSLCRELTVNNSDENYDSIYNLVLRTPLICLLYTLSIIGIDVLKEKSKNARLTYVGHKNG